MQKRNHAKTLGLPLTLAASLVVSCGAGWAQRITFGPPASYGPLPYGTSLLTADFNKDGHSDLVQVTSDDTLRYLQNVGNGTFNGAVTFTMTGASLAGPSDAVVGDFNGDGNPDIAVVHPTTEIGGFGNAVTIQLGDGAGGFSEPGLVFFTGGTDTGIAKGDFNRNGKLDLAVSSCDNGAVYLYKGNGNGTFTSDGSVSPGPCIQVGVPVLLADVNGDHNLDLIVANLEDNDSVYVYLGDGHGAFTGPTRSATSGNYAIEMTVADFNHDGIPDLAVSNYSTNNVSVMFGDGTGNFTVASTINVGTNPWGIKAADFNRDGWADLAVVNSSSGNLSILRNDRTGHFSNVQTIALGVDSRSLAVADFNGDGKPDIAVASDGSNLLVLTNTTSRAQ